MNDEMVSVNGREMPLSQARLLARSHGYIPMIVVGSVLLAAGAILDLVGFLYLFIAPRFLQFVALVMLFVSLPFVIPGIPLLVLGTRNKAIHTGAVIAVGNAEASNSDKYVPSSLKEETPKSLTKGMEEELLHLKEMHEKGLLTDEEFEKMRQRVLGLDKE